MRRIKEKIKKSKKHIKLIMCFECGTMISGSAVSKNLPKTHKAPNRPYGAQFCVNCLIQKIKSKVRGE